jgi:hypothetical protein
MRSIILEPPTLLLASTEEDISCINKKYFQLQFQMNPLPILYLQQ